MTDPSLTQPTPPPKPQPSSKPHVAPKPNIKLFTNQYSVPEASEEEENGAEAPKVPQPPVIQSSEAFPEGFDFAANAGSLKGKKKRKSKSGSEDGKGHHNHSHHHHGKPNSHTAPNDLGDLGAGKVRLTCMKRVRLILSP